MGKQTQTGAVLAHLIKYGKITSIEAFQKYGCTRLSAMIFKFRARGYEIETVDRVDKNRYGNTTTYAEYILKAKPDKEGEKLCGD